MEFSRQEYGSGLPFLFPGDFPNTEIEPTSPVSPALQVGGFFTIVPTRKPMSQWSRICLLMQEMQETQVQSLGLEDPLEKGIATQSKSGKFHGQRSLAGYGQWGLQSRM